MWFSLTSRQRLRFLWYWQLILTCWLSPGWIRNCRNFRRIRWCGPSHLCATLHLRHYFIKGLLRFLYIFDKETRTEDAIVTQLNVHWLMSLQESVTMLLLVRKIRICLGLFYIHGIALFQYSRGKRHGCSASRIVGHPSVYHWCCHRGIHGQRKLWRHEKYERYVDGTNSCEEATTMCLSFSTTTWQGIKNVNIEAGIFYTIRQFVGPMGVIFRRLFYCVMKYYPRCLPNIHFRTGV